MNHDEENVVFPLCRSVESESIRVQVEIYGSPQDGWILEVVDEAGTSHIWEETFATDQEALVEFERALADEGLPGIVSDHR